MLQVRRPAFTELTMLSRIEANGQVDVFINEIWISCGGLYRYSRDTFSFHLFYWQSIERVQHRTLTIFYSLKS